MKKYVSTILKYSFSLILSFITLKTIKDFRYVVFSLLELAAIFTLSDVLVRKSKWFNILNDILMFIFNGELIMLLFGRSYITLVMIQSLTSLEDLQGKAFLYGIGVLLVIGFSVLPVKAIEKINKLTLYSFPLLVIADIIAIFVTTTAMSPYAGAKDLYSQWDDYNSMKKLVAEYKNSGDEAFSAAISENALAEVDYDEPVKGDEKYDIAGNLIADGGNALEENTDERISDNNDELSTNKESSSANTVSANTLADNVNPESTVNEANDNQTASNIADSKNDLANNEENKTNTAVNVNDNNTSGQKTGMAVSKLDPKLAKQFPVGNAIPHNTLPADTNVIVVFVEGLSYNVINDPRDIMPNLKSFKNECITFNNYYNHTFATYRGIQGQLYSGYSLDDYETNHLPSLMSVLKGHGYNTMFINVEPSNKQFTNYLNNMAFDKVYSGTDAEGAAGSLSDRQAYNILFNQAKEYSKKGKPFFIGLYSFGTHVSFDTDENIYEDGSNNFLNRYHNCDYQIGEFVENFKKSDLAKNTLLVITADHSAYADEDFVKTFPDYNRLQPACDKIPLFIYYKGISTTINAEGRNTLDLAPTILDLLGYERPQTFIGYSLYGAKNENTILDSFYWNPDGLCYTGDYSFSYPKKDIKEYVNNQVIQYISSK